MRRILLPLLLAAALARADEASDAFYRAFWLEQAGGELAEAEALYAQVLATHADAPEAPRALLGLVRIRAQRGEDVAELVAQLEKRYPDAAEEQKQARALRALHAQRFDQRIYPDDPPVVRKLKELHIELTSFSGVEFAAADRDFVVDVGAVAHPMLQSLLHCDYPGRVSEAAIILARQRTPEAAAILAHALGDDTILYRASIVESITNRAEGAPVLVDALGRLYESSAPRLRGLVATALCGMVYQGSPGADRAWALLTRALGDADARSNAMEALARGAAPAAYVSALLDRLEAGDPMPATVRNVLPYYADLPGLAERIEREIATWTLHGWTFSEPDDEAGALVLARAALQRRAAGDLSIEIHYFTEPARWSSRAAVEILEAALARGDDKLASYVQVSLQGAKDPRAHLGAAAARLRLEALRRINPVDEPDRGEPTAWRVLQIVGLKAEDYPALARELHPDGGLPWAFADSNFLMALGAERAGTLVDLCRNEKQADLLLRAGTGFVNLEGDAGVPFFARVVPRVGTGAAETLYGIARNPALLPIVVRRLLDARGEEWGWNHEHENPTIAYTGEERRAHPGPYVWTRVKGDAEVLRPLLAGHLDDPREEVAKTAAAYVAGGPDAEALRPALASPFASVRAIALRTLARGPEGAALLAEYARPENSRAVYDVLHRAEGEAYAALAARLLATGDEAWSGLWDAFYRLAPEAAIALALEAAAPEKPATNHRRYALRLLTEVSDPRRLEVFRQVLKGTDTQDVTIVLQAVFDQYLVELGEETLEQLRSPDANVRRLANGAVERLKFYADARRSLGK